MSGVNGTAFPISVDARQPVLIAGPTASGKSALALEIARAQGGVIVNADAMQVYEGWRILSARPSAAEMALAPHALYGHVPRDRAYSTGQWLREVAPYLTGQNRPIIVGGTGLNFTALTEGLADIPATPPEVRARADAMTLPALLEGLDPATKARIDTANRARVQRAFEVLHSTGRPLAAWQDQTPPPLLPLENALALVVDAPKEWLNPRIEARFDAMLKEGLLAEAEIMKQGFHADHPSSKIIGASEMVAYVSGHMSFDMAREAVITGTRQYAKRQRTWLRKRMRHWIKVPVSSTDLSTVFDFGPDKSDVKG